MSFMFLTWLILSGFLQTSEGFFGRGLPPLLSPQTFVTRKVASLFPKNRESALFRHFGAVHESVDWSDVDFKTLEAINAPKKETKIEIYRNGDRYEGEFLDGKRHGQGIQFFAKVGKSLVGDFRKGKIYTGEGTLYIAKTENIFEGIWVRGQFAGYAEFHTGEANERFRYEGNVLNGMRSGQGKLYYPNGQIYTGNFEKGVRHGPGTIVCPSGNTAQGEFLNDRMHNGTGTMEYTSGLTFTGTWVEGWWQGPGRLVTGDGVVYEGNYQEGRLYGPGYVTYRDGHKYKGDFVDGKLTNGLRVFDDQVNMKNNEKDNGTE